MKQLALSLSYPQTVTIENLFSLAIAQKTDSTHIAMQLLHNHVNTSRMPFVYKFLKRHLPTVLLTECYNEDNLPFAMEVRNTELGHLFEHILLEYLCQLKIAKGSSYASFSGRTKWNWVKEPRGMFHISLTCGQTDADILPLALEKTINLMSLILSTEQTRPFNRPKYFYSTNGLKNGKRVRQKRGKVKLRTEKVT